MNVRRQSSAVFQDEVPTFSQSDSRTSSLFGLNQRLRVSNPSSPWSLKVLERLDVLTSLPRGWDGYAGRPVNFTCALFAANLTERLYVEGVPHPQLVPGGDGTVQIEWHRNQFDVEIDVLGPYEVIAVRRNVKTGEIDELELQTDFTLLGGWIAELRSAKGTPLKARA